MARSLTWAIPQPPSQRHMPGPRPPSIFDLCQPRLYVLAGRVADADFAADTPAGAAGYERMHRQDEEGVAPGGATLAELFAGEPTLILLREYLCTAAGGPHPAPSPRATC